eukprot:3048717-Prymnesium_polylepis.4
MLIGPLKTRPLPEGGDSAPSSSTRNDADLHAAQQEALQLEACSERRGYWPAFSLSPASFTPYCDPTGGSLTERSEREPSQREGPPSRRTSRTVPAIDLHC